MAYRAQSRCSCFTPFNGYVIAAQEAISVDTGSWNIPREDLQPEVAVRARRNFENISVVCDVSPCSTRGGRGWRKLFLLAVAIDRAARLINLPDTGLVVLKSCSA